MVARCCCHQVGITRHLAVRLRWVVVIQLIQLDWTLLSRISWNRFSLISHLSQWRLLRLWGTFNHRRRLCRHHESIVLNSVSCQGWISFHPSVESWFHFPPWTLEQAVLWSNQRFFFFFISSSSSPVSCLSDVRMNTSDYRPHEVFGGPPPSVFLLSFQIKCPYIGTSSFTSLNFHCVITSSSILPKFFIGWPPSWSVCWCSNYCTFQCSLVFRLEDFPLRYSGSSLERCIAFTHIGIPSWRSADAVLCDVRRASIFCISLPLFLFLSPSVAIVCCDVGVQ